VSSSAIGSVPEHARECASERLESLLGSVQSSRLGVSSSAIGSVLESMPGSVLQSVLRAYLRAKVKQAGSVPSSAIESILESMPGSVLQSVLRAYLGAYSQAGWECVIESNWERP